MKTETLLLYIFGGVILFFLAWIGIIEIVGGSYTLPLILLGIFTVSIVRAFYKTKTRRPTEDIPTSSITTGAVGSEVEIHGNILVNKATAFTAPLSGKPCGAFLLQAHFNSRTLNLITGEEFEQILESIRKKDCIYVDDGSGSLAFVDLKGPSILKYRKNGIYDEASGGKETKAKINLGNGQFFLRQNPVFHGFLKENQKISWMFDAVDNPKRAYGEGSLTLREWAFSEGTSIYVRGYAQSGLKKRWKPRLSFKNFMKAKKAIKGDEALASRFDTNRDGKLDPDELEEGARTLGLQYESETGPATQRGRLQDKVKMVFQHSRAHPLTVFAGGYNAERVMLENLNKDVYQEIRRGLYGWIIVLWAYFFLWWLIRYTAGH